MKILFVISSLRCGGAERVASTLITSWTAAGHTVSLFTWTPSNTDFFSLPSTVLRTGLQMHGPSDGVIDAIKRNIRRIFHLRRYITSTKPDVIVSFMEANNVISILAGAGLRCPIVVSERSDPERSGIPLPWRLLRKICYPRAALIVTQTQQVKKWATDHFPNTRVVKIPNPLPLQFSTPERHLFGQTAPIDGANAKILLAVGRLAPEKQFDQLIHVFKRIHSRHSDWQLWIVGGGPANEGLSRLVRDAGLTAVVRLVGHVDDVAAYYKVASIFVLCSKFEGFPNALIEAMNFALPCISFNCNHGPAEIIEHEFNGLLISQDDWASLEAAIERIVNDQALASSYGKRARDLALTKYGAQAISSEWLKQIGRIQID